MSKELATQQASFELAQREAKSLQASDLIPKQYKDNIANCMIAMDIAKSVGMKPLMVMQNLNIIHGKPSWSSQFIISAINSCGKFSNLRFKKEGEGDLMSCYAYVIEKGTNERLEGPKASIAMAKTEGWFSKAGSKWKTMPDLMLHYRAAAFFGRLYAPEILNGMYTAEEVEDVGPMIKDITPEVEEKGVGEDDLLKKIEDVNDKPKEDF